MTPLLQLAVVVACSITITAVLASVALSGLRLHALRYAVLVPPIAAVGAVVLSVIVAARMMLLPGHDVQVVIATGAGAGAVAALLGVILAGRVQEIETAAAQAQTEHARASAEQARRDEAETARRELVAGITHDLRTPLAGLRAMAEALEDGVIDDPQRYLRQIRGEVDRLADMVTDLFEVSRLHAGLIQLNPERLALADLVAEAVAITEPLAREHGVHVAAEAIGHIPVEVDARALTRAVGNLLINAIRHTPHDGTIHVIARRDHDGAGLVSVADLCGGIIETDLASVFDLGWQGDTARTPGPNAGAGLGLAIVRAIIEAHGGHVSVQNISGGCRFDVRVPTAPQPEQRVH
jgi:signal transduction histidine kinase